MKTNEFLNLLDQNLNKSLLFEYAPNKLVGANYHITEVKHTKIDSVDCGGETDNWNETIIQLLENPEEKGKRDFMKVEKAVKIFNKVGGLKPFDDDAEVKFEYGNATFNTAKLYVDTIEIKDDSLIFKLSIENTRCKANETCGIPAIKEKVLETESSCCTPESGCC